MYYINHTTPPAPEPTTFLVTGSSGTLYTVNLPTTFDFAPPQRSQTQQTGGAGYGAALDDDEEITQEEQRDRSRIRCNCIDHKIRKTVCKHIIFTCVRVLKLAHAYFETDDTGAQYLLRLSEELAPMIRKALTALEPPEDVTASQTVRSIVSSIAPHVKPGSGSEAGGMKEVQKREVKTEEECPICFEEFGDEIVAHCRYGCGNGVHEACIERYKQAVSEVKCVLCRTLWDIPQSDGGGTVGRRGVLERGRLIELGEFMADDVEHNREIGRKIRGKNVGSSSRVQRKREVVVSPEVEEKRRVEDEKRETSARSRAERARRREMQKVAELGVEDGRVEKGEAAAVKRGRRRSARKM